MFSTMKKHILTILLVMLGLVTFGQQWTAISGNTPSKYQVALVASSERNITVDLQLSGFFTSRSGLHRVSSQDRQRRCRRGA